MTTVHNLTPSPLRTVAERIEGDRTALTAHVEGLMSNVKHCFEKKVRPFVGVKKE